MAGQVAMVKRSTLLACMTCPLCHRLLKEATTISLCLHTFCRDCIYGQFSDEEEDRCPVCNIDLGCQPVEKLRPDHNLQDIVAKLFPETRKTYAPEFNPPSEVTVSPGETQSPEVTPSIPSPVRRKERSLSSLVVSTPKVSTQTGLTGKRSKALTRKAAALRGCGFSAEEPTEDHPMSSSSTESRERHKMEDSPYPDDKNEVEVVEGKADLWTPLNCLVEAANRTKSSKSNSQGALDALNALKLYNMSENKEEDSTNTLDSDVSMTETKKKEVELSAKGKNNSNGAGAPVRRRKSRAANHTKTDLMDSSASAQAMLDANGDQDNRRNCPIWFSLISSENWKGDSPLPQISAGYLRIKDGKMRVSHIQKYVAKKLDLKSEDEVEIMCRGQPVLPSLELESLVDLWLRTAPTQKRVPAVVGSSAKDFVMVLSYCRRVEAPGDNQ